MTAIRDTKSRSEITEATHRQEADLNEQIQELNVDAEDVDVTRETQEAIEGATEEGAEAITDAIGTAEGCAVDQFDQTDRTLEAKQREGEILEADLTDRSERSTRDAETIGEARRGIRRTETASAMDRAEKAVNEELTFLDQYGEKNRSAREKSDAARQDLLRRIRPEEG